MIQVNLVPDVKLELIRAQRHRNWVVSVAVISMLASVAIVVILGLVIGGQALASGSVSKKIETADRKFQGMEDVDKTVTIQNQLASIQSTHDQKAMTSRIFDLLAEASAKGTDNSVSLTSFSVDTISKTVSLLAQTDTRGFEAAEVFRKNIDNMQVYFLDREGDALEHVPNEFLDKPVVERKGERKATIASDVVLSDVAYAHVDGQTQRTVNFRLSFTYNDLLFDGTKDILRIRGLERGNVTDSYTRLPESLFSSSSSQGRAE